MDAPRTARPGGRTARTTTAVLAAAIEELSVHDYADISVESIAARAGVHKTTVYRRWGSKVEIIRQALAGAASTHIPVPDSGSVESDLVLLAQAVRGVLSGPRGAITTALIVGALSSAELAGVMRQFWEVRLEAISVIIDRAVRRGELPAWHGSGRVDAHDVGPAVLPAPGRPGASHRSGREPQHPGYPGRREGRGIRRPHLKPRSGTRHSSHRRPIAEVNHRDQMAAR